MPPRLPGRHALGHHSPGVTHAHQQPCLPHTFVAAVLACVLACLSCLPACLVACFLRPGPPRGLVDCGLWPGQQLSQICTLDSLVCQFMRPSSRSTKSRIDRETGWGRGSQAARLQIATPHSSTAATANGPRPAAPRCWVSIPAATNTFWSGPARALRPARWIRWLVRLQESVTAEARSLLRNSRAARGGEHETRPLPIKHTRSHDGWMMDYPALLGPRERNPSPSSACFTIP